MPRKKSKPKSTVSEKTLAEDDRLRKELEKADPKKFDRLVSPLFRSSKTDAEQTWQAKPEKVIPSQKKCD